MPDTNPLFPLETPDDAASSGSGRSPFPEPSSSLPEQINYIAIDGVIGVGKTTLTHHLARRYNGFPLLEAFEENPFLSLFYQAPDRWALHTQLSFLASRFKQQKSVLNRDLFRQLIISDYTFDKDRIFAQLTLKGDEMQLYDSLYHMVEPVIPKPDLVVYLQSTTDRLMQNISKRGRAMEQDISRSYIQSLVEAYDEYFFRYTKSPLLIVNAARIDFVANQVELDELIFQIINGHHTATTYYNPTRKETGIDPEVIL